MSRRMLLRLVSSFVLISMLLGLGGPLVPVAQAETLTPPSMRSPFVPNPVPADPAHALPGPVARELGRARGQGPNLWQSLSHFLTSLIPTQDEPPTAPAPQLASTQVRIYLPVILKGHSSNALVVTAEQGGHYISNDQQVRLDVPVGAVTSRTTIYFESLETEAVLGYQAAGSFFRLTAQGSDGSAVTQFERPLKLTLRYEGTPGFHEHSLALYYLDEQTGWQQLPSRVHADKNLVVATVEHFTTFALLATPSNDWAIGNIVFLCAGTEIREGSGDEYPIHTIVPEDDWAVMVIDGPRVIAGETWWDTSRREAGDPSGGTGWIKLSQAQDSCSDDDGGGGGEGLDWGIGNNIGLCRGTEIRHGPNLVVHTVVPEDNWIVQVIAGPRMVGGDSWWDTSRAAAGDPSGGTGWVSESQAAAACNGQGSDESVIGLAPLTPLQRWLSRMYGTSFGQLAHGIADPVYPATGNLIQVFTDLHVPGIAGFDFVLNRTYNSRDERPGVFGIGFSTLFDMALRIANDGSIDVRFPDGHGVYFITENGEQYVPGDDGVLASLTYTGDSFRLDTPEQISYVFDARGLLLETYDRYDNTLQFERDDEGRILRVVDTVGREFPIAYEGDHIASISDPAGRTLTYAYDSGNLVSMTDGNSGVHRYEYTDQLLTRITDPEDITYLINTYDEDGRVIEQIDAAGSYSYLDFDTEGEVLFTDNLGQETRIHFDDRFLVTQKTDALGADELYEYDEAYNLTAYVDQLDRRWEYTYDERGNLLTESGPLAWAMIYTYNEENDLTSATDALNRTTALVWENGNLIRVEHPDGTAASYTYDGYGQLLRAQNANGHITRFGYDAEGNLSSVRSHEGRMTRYGYDAVGRLEGMTDGNEHAISLSYDGNDNVVSIVDPKGNESTFEYDGNDLLVRMVDRRGGAWAYEYDVNLKLLSQIDPEGHATTHEYDEMYNRIATTDARNHTTLYRYDALYRLEEIEDALGNVTRFEYDAVGNLIAMVDALSQRTELDYDDLDRLILLTDALDGETRFVYDAVGRLERVQNPRDAVTRYTYDDRDRLITVMDALLGETQYEYDHVGNLTAITDANAHTTLYTYDGDRLLIRVEGPEGRTVALEHDGVGNVVRLVNGRGYVTTFVYDENDNLALVRDALEGETEYGYDAEDALLSITDPNDHTTRFIRNQDGLITRLIEAGGQTTRFEYDATHNLTRLIDARGKSTEFEYDALHRQVTRIDPLGKRTEYAYDALGRLIEVTDALNVVTGYEYDALDRLIAVVQNRIPGAPADYETNVRTDYGYDPVGNLTTITDANGHVTRFIYDLLSRLIRETDAEDHVWRYEYDSGGNLTRRIDANGTITDYAYDADDLLTGIAYPDGSEITFAYDANYNQVRMVDGLGVTHNVYDPLDRLTSSTNHLGQTVGYTYDPVGNRTSVVYPDRRVVRTEYDATNYPIRVIDPDGRTFEAEYDLTHNLTEIRYPNLTRAVMSYDEAGRLTNILNTQLDGDVISSFAYSLDDVGNRTRVEGYYRWRQPRALNHDYAYDPLYRLVSSSDSEGRLTEYVYDAVGNRLSMTSNYDPLRTPTDVKDPYTVAYDYSPTNRLLSTDHSFFGLTEYTYDANGNRVRREEPDVSVGSPHAVLRTDYAYDDENRLVGVENYFDSGNGRWSPRDESTMSYDGYGRLFRRTHDMHQGGGGQKWTDFVYDGLDPIVEYVDPSPQYVNYYRGLGRILEQHGYKSQQSPDGTAYFYHYDGLGSVSAITKHRGQSAHTYRYWDYGMALDKNGGTADSSNFTNPHNHYTYTGQYWDDKNALYHFYAREYDPVTGTWLQQDPYRGRLVEPMTLHRYGYVGGNPISYWDKYGFDRKNAGRGAADTSGQPGDTASNLRAMYREAINYLIRKIYKESRTSPFYDGPSEYDLYLIRYLNDQMQNIPSGRPTTGRITSGYNDLRDGKLHAAVDIADSSGPPIRSTHKGTITDIGVLKCSGYITLSDDSKVYCNDGGAVYVEVTSDPVGKDGIVYITRYLHLKKGSPEALGMTGNGKVEAGDEIGTMGNTGYSTGIHLHYEVLLQEKDQNARKIDPKPYME